MYLAGGRPRPYVFTNFSVYSTKLVNTEYSTVHSTSSTSCAGANHTSAGHKLHFGTSCTMQVISDKLVGDLWSSFQVIYVYYARIYCKYCIIYVYIRIILYYCT